MPGLAPMLLEIRDLNFKAAAALPRSSRGSGGARRQKPFRPAKCRLSKRNRSRPLPLPPFFSILFDFEAHCMVLQQMTDAARGVWHLGVALNPCNSTPACGYEKLLAFALLIRLH